MSGYWAPWYRLKLFGYTSNWSRILFQPLDHVLHRFLVGFIEDFMAHSLVEDVLRVFRGGQLDEFGRGRRQTCFIIFTVQEKERHLERRCVIPGFLHRDQHFTSYSGFDLAAVTQRVVH